MNPKDYVLLLEDLSILVPLNWTVTSLQGMKDLCTMKQALLDSLGPGLGKKPGRASDPNGQWLLSSISLSWIADGWGNQEASIFDKNKHYSDSPQDMIDFSSAHKVSRWSIFFGFGGYEPFIDTPLEIYDLSQDTSSLWFSWTCAGDWWQLYLRK